MRAFYLYLNVAIILSLSLLYNNIFWKMLTIIYLWGDNYLLKLFYFVSFCSVSFYNLLWGLLWTVKVHSAQQLSLSIFLGIGRPTFYRRAKKFGIETNKHSYSDEEIKLLSQKSTVKKDFKSNTYKEIHNNDSVSMIQEQLQSTVKKY